MFSNREIQGGEPFDLQVQRFDGLGDDQYHHSRDLLAGEEGLLVKLEEHVRRSHDESPESTTISEANCRSNQNAHKEKKKQVVARIRLC